MAIDALIKDSRVLICAGTGGVGKTTVSASIALRAGELGLKTLVITVDPAKRLATSLGLDLDTDRETLVPGTNEVWGALIDSQKTFRRFIEQSALSPQAAERLMKNPLYVQLSTTLSGSQEFTSLERVLDAVQNGKFDLIVLDTPPSQHALDFLTAPQRIRNLFQDSITRWFAGAGGIMGGGVVGRWVGRGTSQALQALEFLTGSKFIQDLSDFFVSIHSFQKTLQEHARAIDEILHASSTRFVLITSFDQTKLDEANDFTRELHNHGFHFAATIVNRAFPDWLKMNGQIDGNDMNNNNQEKIVEYVRELQHYFARKTQMYDNFYNQKRQTGLLVKIPELSHDVSGLEDLKDVYRLMRS